MRTTIDNYSIYDEQHRGKCERNEIYQASLSMLPTFICRALNVIRSAQEERVHRPTQSETGERRQGTD